MLVDHTAAVCRNDHQVAIPQTYDLTDTYVITCDFSRKTNIDDNLCHQLAVLACAVFKNDDKKGG